VTTGVSTQLRPACALSGSSLPVHADLRLLGVGGPLHGEPPQPSGVTDVLGRLRPVVEADHDATTLERGRLTRLVTSRAQPGHCRILLARHKRPALGHDLGEAGWVRGLLCGTHGLGGVGTVDHIRVDVPERQAACGLAGAGVIAQALPAEGTAPSPVRHRVPALSLDERTRVGVRRHVVEPETQEQRGLQLEHLGRPRA
jgi:hypothetical protein